MGTVFVGSDNMKLLLLPILAITLLCSSCSKEYCVDCFTRIQVTGQGVVSESDIGRTCGLSEREAENMAGSRPSSEQSGNIVTVTTEICTKSR